MTSTEPPHALKEYICSGASLIMKLGELNDQQKSLLLGRLLGLGAGAAWQPIGITHKAVKLFVRNDFKKPKGLERAHIKHRRDTMKKLIERLRNNEEWWDWYKERDYTILATRGENRDEANFDKVPKIQIPKEQMLFKGKRVGFEYGDPEKEFIINAARELKLI